MNSHRPATMIKFLPGGVLLEIFDLCRMDEVATSNLFPWKWHRLAHVCRTWRDIIFASSRRLNLELLCTRGTPVRKNLGHLPALPIVIHFADPFGVKNSDEDNLIAVLEHPDRVCNVELYVSCSLLGKLATVMQGPFPALTYLWLELDRGPFPYISLPGPREEPPVLPDAFLGACTARLQKIHLVAIPFPAAPTLLLSARDLVEVDLRDIPDTGYISPEAMATGLAALSKLKYLTLGLRCRPPYPDQIRQPLVTRTALPVLASFKFNGSFDYSEGFLAQIDAPQLNWLEIGYLIEDEDFNFSIPQLCKFIDRSENLKPSQFRRVDLDFESSTIDIRLGGGPSSLKLNIQEDGIGQVLSQFSAMLSNVDRLFISSGFHTEPGDGTSIWWLELLRHFVAVKELAVQSEISHWVALVLKNVTEERAAEVLPALELLCLEGRLVTSVKEFVAARQNVGRPVTFVSEFLQKSGSDIGE